MLAFFTGRHEDYHETTNKFDKVNISGMRRIVRVAEQTVARLAEVSGRPEYAAAVPPEQQEPYLGTFGDFTRKEGGYPIGPVAKGGPAERAGMHDGDVVVQFGQDRIADVEDFEEALTHHLGGERVHVVVKRGNHPGDST